MVEDSYHAPSPAEFMREYARRTNTHRFEEVAGLIAPDAIFWFSDGSYRGLPHIQAAFEKNWQTIQDEQYIIGHIEWIAADEQVAVCIYSFTWQGLIHGRPASGSGRGTSVLQKMQGGWMLVHEHLSRKV